MAKNWDIYSRQGIDLAHTVTSVGFQAAKVGTKLGFSIARGIATTAVGITTTAVDYTLFGGYTVTRPVFGNAVSTVITLAEQITLAPIHLSEHITSTSLIAAHSSINVLSAIFPGSSDASFSLASFIGLVRREWAAGDILPERQFGITQVARAIVGWSSLQGVTQEWQEKQWFEYLREIDIKDPAKTARTLERRSSRIRVTSDVIFPGTQGPQIIAADIGEPLQSSSSFMNLSSANQVSISRSRASSIYLSQAKSHLSLTRNRAARSGIPPEFIIPQTSLAEHKTNLRRLSKMVLAGYGGATLLFFGVSPSAFGIGSSSAISSNNTSKHKQTSKADAVAQEKSSEESQLASAVDASEAEAAGTNINLETAPESKQQEYSWWDVLLGKHDKEIFERSTTHPDDHAAESKRRANMKGKMKTTAVIGNEHLMPRFWVLTDHNRSQIVLVIRGTMSLNEIAVDLTCEPETFCPASTPLTPDDVYADDDDDDTPIPGKFVWPSVGKKESQSSTDEEEKYQVHGGMMRMAKAMGDVGKPIHLAVLEALYNNPDFDLILCGHSLGAGVAAILGMMWADPKTCLTVRSSGLPVGRRVQVYCFAPPSLTDPDLSQLSSKLIVSLVYSHDVVARLSLGSVRNLRNAAMWLCEAEIAGEGTKRGNGNSKSLEGWSAVIQRAKRWQTGEGTPDDMDWFIAMRKTLEANMQNTHFYPPGRVLWAMRDGDLHPAHQKFGSSMSAGSGKDKLRVFEVLNVEKVFSQIVFARNMLTAHMPHQYDQVIHDLL
ncbi:hypothetical protein CPB83DRAFT_795112 [Crepidotus variabilis]|uniref:sn-1-specific diacylglycerol lipase n=1 Tax=Crepidotus variabilis TaxID=179855 RepID=A0A9P6EC47_9AGAR|nr:hypothetical protein CPB83DRAFT_795112 [Crepidotus variabilis]